MTTQLLVQEVSHDGVEYRLAGTTDGYGATQSLSMQAHYKSASGSSFLSLDTQRISFWSMKELTHEQYKKLKRDAFLDMKTKVRDATRIAPEVAVLEEPK